MLLVYGPAKALRDQDKLWLFCRRTELFRMGRPEKSSQGKVLQNTSKREGIWKGRGGRKEVRTACEGPERKLYVQSLGDSAAQLEQEEVQLGREGWEGGWRQPMKGSKGGLRLGFNPEGSEIRHDLDAMLYRNQSDAERRTRRKTDSGRALRGQGGRAALPPVGWCGGGGGREAWLRDSA